jgi:hypothetical protein
MSAGTTYDARVYQTEVYKGSEVTTYKVRWKVGARLWKEGFRNAAQADSFRSALLTAARKGEPFSLATGRPTAWERKKAQITWYEFACVLRGHEVEAGLRQVPQGHRPRLDSSDAGHADRSSRPTGRCEHSPGAGPMGIQHEAAHGPTGRGGRGSRLGLPITALPCRR